MDKGKESNNGIKTGYSRGPQQTSPSILHFLLVQNYYHNVFIIHPHLQSIWWYLSWVRKYKCNCLHVSFISNLASDPFTLSTFLYLLFRSIATWSNPKCNTSNINNILPNLNVFFSLFVFNFFKITPWCSYFVFTMCLLKVWLYVLGLDLPPFSNIKYQPVRIPSRVTCLFKPWQNHFIIGITYILWPWLILSAIYILSPLWKYL